MSAAEAFAYDQVAYPSPIVPAQTPDRIAAAGLLHGWAAPDPLTASVLEIGCGDGLNLIAIAATAPRARCTGFDLSAPAIAAGRELAFAAGLRNVDLETGDIMTWPQAGERFDYILCHGVHSWVPPAVREALMALIGARLKPGGIAYVSYDCLPATLAKRTINRFLVGQTAALGEADARVAAALNLVKTLDFQQNAGSVLKPTLAALIERQPTRDDAYFYHDWLGGAYHPSWTADFEAEANAAGLTMIGDAMLGDLYLDELDAEARALVDAQTGFAARAAWLDMLRGEQTFRRGLLVRRGAPPPQATDPLGALRFGFLGEAVEHQGILTYRIADGTQMAATTPLAQAVLAALHQAAPGELTRNRLVALTGAAQRDVEDLLRTLAAIGLLDCHATPQSFVVVPGERPRAGTLIRTMLRTGADAVNLRHIRSTAQADATRLLLILCDGTRTRDGLAAEMTNLCGIAVSRETVDDALLDLGAQALFDA